NRQLEEKREKLGCELDIREMDLEKEDLPTQFDGIISSMTMHHVRDINAMFRRFHDHVKPGGFIAIADLEKEDGTFHTEDTGVFHFGFEHGTIAAAAEQAGFSNVEVQSVSVIEKDDRGYPVFLLTATA
ncbi:MAG: class I SAM-dependent methyltransferase, partial [Marinobacter sp.]|nr:class I SAM-dependent methyltransferase [Marinobacter sp.]